MNENKSTSVSLPALRERFSGCADFTERQIRYGLEQELSLPVCWLDGTVSGAALGLEILRPLTELLRSGRVSAPEAALERIRAGGVYRCGTWRRRTCAGAAACCSSRSWAAP